MYDNNDLINKYNNYVYDIITDFFHVTDAQYKEELCQCGVVGLLKANKNYDKSKSSFCTYSRFFIIREITNQMCNDNHTTIYNYSRYKKIIKAIDKLSTEGKKATPEAIAEVSGLKKRDVKYGLAQMNFTDQIYVDQNPDGLEDIKDGSQLPEDMAIHMDLHEIHYKNLEKLPDLPKRLLKMRYLQDMSVKDICKSTGLFVGAVQDNINKGLAKMKEYLSEGNFEEYLFL